MPHELLTIDLWNILLNYIRWIVVEKEAWMGFDHGTFAKPNGGINQPATAILCDMKCIWIFIIVFVAYVFQQAAIGMFQ